jgi:Flp pilus assembly protein TadD
MKSLFCTACRSDNSIDSKFCKNCGRELDRPAVVSSADADSLVKDGFRLLHEGNASEANFIAGRIVAAQPNNPAGHALRAMCFEEAGDLVGAIAAYEQVVRLRPDSRIDQLRLSQLRKKLDESIVVRDTRSSRLVPIMSGVVATLVVSALGVALALPKDTRANAAESPQTQELQPAAKGFEIPATRPQTPQNTAQPNAAQQPRTQTAQGSGSAGIGNPMRNIPPVSFNNFEISPSGGNQLPAVTSEPPATANPTFSQGTSITPKNSVQPPTGDANVLSPKRDPGKILIAESDSRPANNNDRDVSENTYRVAQQKMASGDYRGAIRDFTAALGGSRRPGLIHQLIGRCYARIGETGNARQHFETALQIYEAAGATGEARACRRELELLG